MRAVSQAFKEAIGGQNRQISGAILGDGLEIRDALENFKIETAAAPLATSMRKFSAKLHGTDFDLIGKILTPQIEVNGQILALEPFEITEVKANFEDATTQIIGFDGMLKTHKNFEPSRHNFPCQMADFLTQIALVCDLELSENLDILPLQIPTNYFEKSQITYREILKQIAEISGGIFLIRGGKLAFSKLKTDEIAARITDFDLKTLTLGQNTAPINSLVLSRSPQEDNIFHRSANFNGENLSELKIVNNELVDKRRSEVTEAIFARVEGISWREFKAESFGFGYLEAGDRVELASERATAESIILESTLEVGQSIRESFSTAPLNPTLTNYKRASDIVRKIHNTEIIVDKQNQFIENIVEEKREFEGKVEADFSKMKQDLRGFDIQIQKSGGLNLLKNTAFWSQTNGELNFWAVEGAVTAISSQEVKNYGGISGRVADLAAGSKLRQEVVTVAGEIYSFSAKVKKSPLGALKFRLISGQNILREEEIPAGVSKAWEEIAFTKVEATSPSLTLEILAENHPASLSDLMLANAPDKTLWTMAQGEIANTGVVIDEKGITVNSSINQGDTVEITPLEFAGYSQIGGSRKRVFSVNKDTTEVKKLRAEDELSMAPLKIVAIKTGDTQGWAFVGDAK